ncbi:MAG: hypothetical protein U0Y82_00335 [Thermoleophilia bacterium]
MTRVRVLCAVLVACLLGIAGPALGQPGVTATVQGLRDVDVYVAPSLRDSLAVGDIDRLLAQVDKLGDEQDGVKLALVADTDGLDPFEFAARVRTGTGFTGTVVTTTPAGPTGAAGPRTPQSIHTSLTAGRVDAVTNPVDRLLAAAPLAVPAPAPSRHGTAWRELAVLIGLTLLGGAWAIAWGLRREQRRTRTNVADRRAGLRVRLDALRAQASAVHAGTAPPDPVLAALEDLGDAHTRGLAAAGLERATDMDEAEQHLARGVDALHRARELADLPPLRNGLYQGLCSVDPGHGVATALARLPGRSLPAPVCAACQARVEEGDPPARRLVPVHGRPVPFDEAS